MTSALLVLCMAACGGGGDSGAEPPTQSPAAVSACTPKAAIRVQLFGDSTQNGNGVTSADNTPPALLQAALDARWPGVVTVINSAIAGSTADQGATGYGGYQRWPADVAGDIVVVNWGINDATWRTPEAYRNSLMAMHGVTLFETPNPIVPQTSTDTAVFAQVMRDVAAAQGIPVADVQSYVLSLPGWQGMFADGIHHPNDDLYRLISKNVLVPSVMEQAAKLMCQ